MTKPKVYSLKTLLEHVNVWRRQGLRVGFTNGCFDLLHPGHELLLRQSKEACDKLIVGLNADTSVKRLKGDDRPIQNEEERANALAALEDVDAVTIFAEDTPLELIIAIEPDVLVKGEDYKHEDVVGAKEVEARGGKVVLAKLLAGHSTTAIIEKLNHKN